MKCPNCGQWNKASLPHCMRCGAPLNIDESSRVSWKEELKDTGLSSAYLRADEYGLLNNAAPDSRDVLAGEMQDLKKRKKDGAARLSEMKANLEKARARSATRGEQPSVWESAEVGNSGTIRIRKVSGDTRAEREEAEARHRVRFMDDMGSVENRSYDPYDPYIGEEYHPVYSSDQGFRVPSRFRRRKLLLRLLIALLSLGAVVAGVVLVLPLFVYSGGAEPDPNVLVTASMVDDLAAHTIMIPGEDGQQIYIRELHASYLVTEGYATIQVPDHTWYDNYEGTLEETMDVTLTPFLKTASGQQKPLSPIEYSIIIPLSPIKLDSPDAMRTVVSTMMATIKITVRPGSKVYINGVDNSYAVSSDTGEMSYNATVQPIGDNPFNIVVRSQYCRDNSIQVVFYRAPQEIPLDLAVGTYGTTYDDVIRVSATTLPGAYVEVTSPYSDLNITELDTTGKFSFNAIFTKIGNNTISIKASYPGKKPSVVEHTVYYVPPASKYTVKAWPMRESDYNELLSNINVRATNMQVYVITGVVQRSVSIKPQMVIINTSEDGKSRPVLLQNYSKTTWQVGTYYRIFADAYSTYNGIPWLNARYTYTK